MRRTALTSTEKIRVDLTDREILERSRLQSRCMGDLEQKTAEFAVLRADYKAAEAGLMSEISRLARVIRDGWEMQDVECPILYNKPTEGVATIVRPDTFEEIRRRSMTHEESQTCLRFEGGEEGEGS